MSSSSINQWDFSLSEFPNAVAYTKLYPVIDIKNSTCVFSPIDQNAFIGCLTTFQDLSFAGIMADMVKLCTDNCVRVINLWHNCQTQNNYSHPDLLAQYYKSACTEHPTQGYNCLSNRLSYMQSKGNSIQDYLQNTGNGLYTCDSCTRVSMQSALAGKDYLSVFSLQNYGVDELNKAQGYILNQCGKPYDQLQDPKPLTTTQMGLIIGGSVFLFFLLAFLIFYVFRRRKRSKMLRPPPSQMSTQDSTSTLLQNKLPFPSGISQTNTNSNNYLNEGELDDQYAKYKVSSFQ